MKRLLVASILIGLTLTGCCTRQRLDEWSRFEGTENRPSGFCGIFSGFGTLDEPDRWTALYSPVGVLEYGDLLCGHLELEDYGSCVNRVWGHYREAQRKPSRPGASTSGPFAAVIYDEVFLGSYWSDPFSASFQVSNAGVTCRGSYSALYGEQLPIFDVDCDNGMRGKADIVLDRSGRSGTGGVYMDDGAEGRILFGHAVVDSTLELAQP